MCSNIFSCYPLVAILAQHIYLHTIVKKMLCNLFISLINFLIPAVKDTFVFTQAVVLVRLNLTTLKVCVALAAPEVYLVENIEHNPVHFCCVELVATARAIVALSQPRLNALFADQFFAGATLLRCHHNFSADQAKEIVLNQRSKLRINFEGVRVGKF